jgi:hypothetical protein
VIATPLIVRQVQRQAYRQLDHLAELPHELTPGRGLRHDPFHSHPPLADVLVHIDHVADVILGSLEWVKLKMGARPPLLVGLIVWVGEEVEDLAPRDAVYSELCLENLHGDRPFIYVAF